MDSQDKVLEQYLKGLMDQTMGMTQPELLTDAQLKEIALDAGMTEFEYAEYLNRAKDYKQQGFVLVAQGNFKDAREAFLQCITITPNDLEALLALARTYYFQAQRTADWTLMADGEVYLERSLRLDPDHREALALKTQIKEAKEATKKSKKVRVGLLVLFFGIGVLGLIVAWFSLRNELHGDRENIKAAQIQVASVYERSSRLLPKLEGIAGASSQGKADFEELFAAYEQGHLKLEESIQVGDTLGTRQALQALDNWRERVQGFTRELAQINRSDMMLKLLDEVAGSENRIFIERRSYNQLVQDYNAKIGRFPHSLFGQRPVPYWGTKEAIP